jgi:putative RecB family exonuclease
VTVQFELPGMPVPLYPCTPTRLTLWRDCPRRYRFTYLDRPAPPRGAPWAHTSVGASVHSVLADWWGLPTTARTPSAAAGLVRRRWLRDGFRDDGQSARYAAAATGWVETYLDAVDPTVEPLGVERTVATRTATLALSGRADRIDERDGAAVVVDYKTGRHVPTEADARASTALSVYTLGARDTLHRNASRVELHHLPSGTVAAAELSEDDLERTVAEAAATGAQCRAADAAFAVGETAVFAPRPADRCSWCDFRRHCPEGRAAAPDRPAWSGLVEL